MTKKRTTDFTHYTPAHHAWAYLSRVCGGPQPAIHALLAAGHTITKIAHAVRHREEWIGPLLAITQTRYQRDHAAADLRQITALGGRMICAEDPEFQGLGFEQSFGFAQEGLWSARADVYPPLALWVIGQDLRTLCSYSCSIVGARNHSNYGTHHARSIARDLSHGHATIVSGGALGIDAVAHEACLDAGGNTIAVFAGGLNQLYPRSNVRLFARIPEKGALVSEYPPDFYAKRHRFLTRNRLVAALSQGTVVIEAGFRSGALNTLSWAAALGKAAMVLPGPADSSYSLGCHERLRNREAELILHAKDIAALLNPKLELAMLDIDVAGMRPTQKLSHKELQVFDALSKYPQGHGDIANAAGFSTGLTLTLLVALEKAGLAQRQGAKWLKTPRALEL
ncbi:MAG: DNA-processing protein DprA [Corynebacterium sp.]|nr:DNA-processing protein DprA [Corynebacterium sp.]